MILTMRTGTSVKKILEKLGLTEVLINQDKIKDAAQKYVFDKGDYRGDVKSFIDGANWAIKMMFPKKP